MGNGPTKSIPIESQGFVGTGSKCRFPVGRALDPLDLWHVSQDLQNSSISLAILGHQNQRLAYPSIRHSFICPTTSCAWVIILVISSRLLGTTMTCSRRELWVVLFLLEGPLGILSSLRLGRSCPPGLAPVVVSHSMIALLESSFLRCHCHPWAYSCALLLASLTGFRLSHGVSLLFSSFLSFSEL